MTISNVISELKAVAFNPTGFAGEAAVVFLATAIIIIEKLDKEKIEIRGEERRRAVRIINDNIHDSDASLMSMILDERIK